jgi:RNA polymerase sigma-70 factor (ECF subfamily)
MLAFANGDAGAFDALYARHRGWLYRMLVRQLPDAARADDVFQETWFALIRSAPSYAPRARFTTWLYLLARQRIADHWRASNPGEFPLAFNEEGESSDADVLDALIDDDSDPSRLAERRELAARLVAAIGTLPPLQREALLLAEEAGMSMDEIAVATATERETVKSRLRYARRKLARLLEEDRS